MGPRFLSFGRRSTSVPSTHDSYDEDARLAAAAVVERSGSRGRMFSKQQSQRPPAQQPSRQQKQQQKQERSTSSHRRRNVQVLSIVENDADGSLSAVPAIEEAVEIPKPNTKAPVPTHVAPSTHSPYKPRLILNRPLDDINDDDDTFLEEELVQTAARRSNNNNNNNNKNKQSNRQEEDVTLLKTQLRDAQRVVRAVLGLADHSSNSNSTEQLDAAAGLRAIRQFAALQNQLRRLQRELQLSQQQRAELERQWTALAVEKNRHVVQVSALQAELEKQHLQQLKQQEQQQLMSTSSSSITSSPEDGGSGDAAAPDATNPVTPTHSQHGTQQPQQQLDNSINQEQEQRSPWLFLDSSNSTNTTSYQQELEQQLEECQALLQQRHIELQSLTDQLADARTQLLEAAHHLTASEEIKVLQLDLSQAQAELDELEQERQMNMSEIVDLNKQVLVLKEQNQQQSNNSVSDDATMNTVGRRYEEMEDLNNALQRRIQELEQIVTIERAQYEVSQRSWQNQTLQQLQKVEQSWQQQLQQQRESQAREFECAAQAQMQLERDKHSRQLQLRDADMRLLEVQFAKNVGKLAKRAVDEHRAQRDKDLLALQQAQREGQRAQVLLDGTVQQLDAAQSQVQDYQRVVLESQQAQKSLLKMIECGQLLSPSSSSSSSSSSSNCSHMEEKKEDDAVMAGDKNGVVENAIVPTDKPPNDPPSSATATTTGPLLEASNSQMLGSDDDVDSVQDAAPLTSWSMLLTQLQAQRDELQRQHLQATERLAELQVELLQQQQLAAANTATQVAVVAECDPNEEKATWQAQHVAPLQEALERTQLDLQQTRESADKSRLELLEQQQQLAKQQVEPLQEALERAQLELEQFRENADKAHLVLLELQQKSIQDQQQTQRMTELHDEMLNLQAQLQHRQAEMEKAQEEHESTKSLVALLEQDLGALQAELDDIAQHDVGQQLLYHIRAQRARSHPSDDNYKDSIDDDNNNNNNNDPFASDKVNQQVALQAALLRTQAQLRRQEDMYRMLADEADELRGVLTTSKELVEDLEQQRNFNQAKVSELSRMIQLRGQSDVEERLLAKAMQCASLNTQVESLSFKLKESQRKMERMEQERQINLDKLKELGQIWDSHAIMEQAQKDMQNKVTEVIERWEASETRAEQMQMEREMSVERVTKLSFELAESRARVDELMEELDHERRSSRSMHGGSFHGGSVVSMRRSSSSNAPNSRSSGVDAMDTSRHGMPSPPSNRASNISSSSSSFFGKLAMSTISAAAAVTGVTGKSVSSFDDSSLGDADTAAGIHMNDDFEEAFDHQDRMSGSTLTSEQAHISTIRKLMKKIERLEEEKSRFSDAVTSLESGLQQVQRENVVKSAKISHLEKMSSGNVIDTKPKDALERERVVLQLKQSSDVYEGSMLALKAELKDLRSNLNKNQGSPQKVVVTVEKPESPAARQQIHTIQEETGLYHV